MRAADLVPFPSNDSVRLRNAQLQRDLDSFLD